MPSRPDNFHTPWLQRLLWLGVCACGVYFARRLLLQEKFGFHDWYLFIGHAQDFVSHRQLYDRDLSHYGPSAAVYKFPPLFASLLVLLLDSGLDEKTLRLIALAGHLLCYFFSVQLCVKLFRPAGSRCYTPLALVIALTFEPFFENYDSAQMEMYILLLLVLALHWMDLQKPVAAGTAIGIAAALKIYPIYLAGYWLARKNVPALLGVAIGLAACGIFTLLVIGLTEHVFFFSSILPVLLGEAINHGGVNLSFARLLWTAGLSEKQAVQICWALLLAPLAWFTYRSVSRNEMRAANRKPSGELLLLVPLLLLGMKNAWSNYQILLLPALLSALALTMQLPGKRTVPVTLLATACFMIFWCNLGKLDTLILVATWILDTSPLLTKVMLQTGFLRGLATGFVLLALLYLRWRSPLVRTDKSA